MKNLKKKGFTIVELVIVIAVIAILSAVLIPTFSSLIRKANISSDTVLSKNLNTALNVYEVENGVETFDQVIEAIKENGYLIANLNAKTSGCFFVWESESNQILLVDSKNNYEVLFSLKEYAEIGSTWHFAISNKEVAESVMADLADKNVVIKQTVATVDDLKDWISSSGTQTIYIDESFDTNKEEQLVVDGGEITIKLSGATVYGNKNKDHSVDNIPFLVKSGSLTIEGGVINASGTYLDADGEEAQTAVFANGGELNLNNTEFDAIGNTIIIAYVGSTGSVSNTKVTSTGQAIGVFGGSNVVVENCTVNSDYEAIFVSNSEGVSSATIKGGKYSCGGNTIVSHGGLITIEDGEFSSTQYNLFKLYSTGSNITLKGGTYTANGNTYTFDQLDVNIIKNMIATTSNNYNSISVIKNNDGSFTLSN